MINLMRHLSVLLIVFLTGCVAPAAYITEADKVGYAIIAEKRAETGLDQSFTIASAEEQLRHRLLGEQQLVTVTTPEVVGDDTPISQFRLNSDPFQLLLDDALQVAAQNSHTYQTNKETIFRQALALDLERDGFRSTFSGLLSSLWSSDKGLGGRRNGLHYTAQAGVVRQFKSGASFITSIGLDLVQLLTANRVSARGLVADASISIPLLRGAGAEVVTEPLQQAERNVLYAMWMFERYRRSFAVQVASEYLLALERMNRVDTAYDNYQRLVVARKRAKRLADAGRLPGIQVDQALQDELRARVSWVSAQQKSAESLDGFKLTLGLPTDARLELDRQILSTPVKSLADSVHELVEPPSSLLQLALASRRDLRIEHSRVADSQRKIRLAEDALRADVTLLGKASDGAHRSILSVERENVKLNPDNGDYSVLLSIDLPFERSVERNALRNRLIDFAASQRAQQQLEDLIKYQVRSAWRGRLEAFELIQIQQQALRVAKRRVMSTDLFLQAGRIQIRDLLEAQDDLVSAENSLLEAQVQYRIRAMELMRDVGSLEIDATRDWLEDVNEYAELAQ